VAGTIVEGADMASVRLIVVRSTSHCGCVHDRTGRCSGLCSLVRRGLSQRLLCRTRQMRALLWPLFSWSAWAQPAIVMAGTKFEGATLASVLWFGVRSASHCGGEHDS
jgi:hypothetical protein